MPATIHRSKRRALLVATSVGAAAALAAPGTGAAAEPGSYAYGAPRASNGVGPVALHAPAASQAAKRGRTYGGSTSTDDPIVLVLARDGKRITRVSTSLETTCQTDNSLSRLMDSAVSIKVSKSGRFSGVERSTGDLGGGFVARDTVTLSGRVSGRSISGTVGFVAAVADGTGNVVDRCTVGPSRFRVVSAPGKVFAGHTTQGGPVVVELTPSRNVVNHFHIGWQSNCAPDGFIQIGDTLTRFAIVGNRFGDTFEQEFNEPDGVVDRFAYAISGTLRGARMTGSFRVTFTETDQTGATTATCESGAMRFTASSG